MVMAPSNKKRPVCKYEHLASGCFLTIRMLSCEAMAEVVPSKERRCGSYSSGGAYSTDERSSTGCGTGNGSGGLHSTATAGASSGSDPSQRNQPGARKRVFYKARETGSFSPWPKRDMDAHMVADIWRNYFDLFGEVVLSRHS